jgi:predicted AAA+ superfamily ATPase
MVRKSDLLDVISFQKMKIDESNFGQVRNELSNINDTPSEFALIISGIRRCGKSTLLNQFIIKNKLDSYLYLNFDSAKLFTFELQDFQLLDEIIKDEKYKWLVFDEIQIIEGWEIYIRQKLDEGFKIVITGSNASLLSRELGTKLTGRHITKELFPFSFKEFCSFKKLETDENSLNEYLIKGGFPGFLKSENTDIHTALIDDIMYRDIAVRHNLRDVKSLKILFNFLATNATKLISANKLKQYVGLKSTATVIEYLNYFEESYLIELVSKFSYSLKSQLVNPKKVYFIDNGLQQSATLSFTKDMGRRLENMVFWEYRRQKKTIYYFNENNKECDFVIGQNEKVEQVVQVCLELNHDNQDREINGLIEAMNFFQLEAGTIITFNQEDVIIVKGKRINVVPAYIVFGKDD